MTRDDMIEAMARAISQKIPAVETEAMDGDCLAVMLASSFENSRMCPEDGDMDDSGAWPQWAIDEYGKLIAAIAREAATAALAAIRAQGFEIVPVDPMLAEAQSARANPLSYAQTCGDAE